MLDGGRIVGGIALVLVLSAGPAWVASVHARGSGAPPIFATQGPCVEPRATMLREHPKILAEWREQAVRNGVRLYHARDGTYPASLSGACLHCHQTAEGFCSRCHAEVGVFLNCWSCHKDSPGESLPLASPEPSPHFSGRMAPGAFGWPGMR